ncbi:ATP-binding protein [Candidatus Omnitrophota bacterium]
MAKEKIRVLLVEDNPTDALIVRKKLERDGTFDYEIMHVVSGESAISTLEKELYHIALLDYNLPKKSGLETLREIKARDIKIPVVMITGQDDEVMAAQLIKEGAFDYLAKRESYEDSVPLMIRKTIAEFRSVLERERLQREIASKKDELEKANEQLQRLDRMKSDFVANVVHEIRTPLTVIKGNLDNIDKGFAGEVQPKQKEILSNLFRTVDRLKRLVSDLLDLSKIESGKMQLNKEDLDIVELAEDVMKGFDKLATDKNIEMKREFLKSAVTINADRDKLTQVFVNLIGNAVKFTDKGSITVRIIELQDEVQAEIQDSGSGMDKEKIDKIFDKFVRILAEKKEGTGLGLPIAKDIIELHKGRIRVKSAFDKGSTFIFNIPKKGNKKE